MRTTLDIADDVLVSARALADRDGRSLGAVMSDLARRSLIDTAGPKVRNWIPQLPISRAGVVVTTEMVAKLIEEADREDVEAAAELATGRRDPIY